MKKITLIAAVSALLLTACETKQGQGTAIGAGAGALTSLALGGNALTTGLAAVGGGLLGNVVGGEMDHSDRKAEERKKESNEEEKHSKQENKATLSSTRLVDMIKDNTKASIIKQEIDKVSSVPGGINAIKNDKTFSSAQQEVANDIANYLEGAKK